MDIVNETDELLCRKKAAKFLDFSPGTLAVWDCTKRYNLEPIKIGRSIRYKRSVLIRFRDERQRP